MKLAKVQLPDGEITPAVVQGEQVVPLELPLGSLSDLLEQVPVVPQVQRLLESSPEGLPLEQVRLLPPVDGQEIWAAGVTYRRSRTARMEESEQGATFYDKVYTAPRPELFFKATARRAVGPGGPVRVRADSHWSVPEPELTLVVNSRGQLVGYTVGNDMSARDIEGENPLYLPQAKVYSGSCAVGPWVLLAEAAPPAEQFTIRMIIRRGEETVYDESIGVDQMARSLQNLIDYLFRDNDFPDGVLLMTGTGLVPPDHFTLREGDVVRIEIDPVGVLENPVVGGPAEPSEPEA